MLHTLIQLIAATTATSHNPAGAILTGVVIGVCVIILVCVMLLFFYS